MKQVLILLATACCACSKADPSSSAVASSAATAALPTAHPTAFASGTATAEDPEKAAKREALATAKEFLSALNVARKKDKGGNIGLDPPDGSFVVFKEDTDPNKLLGRPGQYLAKLGWKCGGGGEGTVEIFATVDDAKTRAEYVTEVTKGMPALAQYIYVNERRKAVLRLPHELTPSRAKLWKEFFDAL